MHELEQAAGQIRSPGLREVVRSVLANPAPTFMARLATPESRDQVRRELVSAGLLDATVTVERLFPPLADPMRAPQSFLAAPANGVHGHHSHPGGLAEHTAFNLTAALDFARNYERHTGLAAGTLDRDVLIAAALLHDAMKPWCLQWQPDGTLTVQASVAGTASHHPFVVAEALHRKLAPEVVVAIASAHEDPLGDTEAQVVGYLRAGAILAGVDPVASGLLVRKGDGFALARPPRVEAVINHMADHDYVLSEPAAHGVDAALERLAQADGAPLPTAQVLWMEHRIDAQIPAVALYAAWSKGGDAALRTLLEKRHVPLRLASDAAEPTNPEKR